MKQSQSSLLSIISLCILLTASTTVQAYEQVTEMTYDDLVQELSQKKAQVTKEIDRASDPKQMHFGIGLIGAMTNIHRDNSNSTRNQNGYQLSLGTDITSARDWLAEGVMRDFMSNSSGTESRKLQELDFKLAFRPSIADKTRLRIGGGLGFRRLSVNDSAQGFSKTDNTPTSIFFAGFDWIANKNISAGAEFGGRSALVTNTMDKNSLDVTFRLDTSF